MAPQEKDPANPLRRLVHYLAPIPLVALAVAYFTDNLSINPIQVLNQLTGDIAIIFLLLTLACSPVHTLFDLPMVLKLRRPLGLWTFYYASLHFLSYIGLDYGFNFRLFRLDNISKAYVWVGMFTLLTLSALAFTSRKWWKKQLGKNWKRLHKLVYVAGALAVLHLGLVVKGNLLDLKGDIWKPFTAGIILIFLLALRVPVIKSWVIKQRQKRQAAHTLKRIGAQQPKAASLPNAVVKDTQPGNKANPGLE